MTRSRRQSWRVERKRGSKRGYVRVCTRVCMRVYTSIFSKCMYTFACYVCVCMYKSKRGQAACVRVYSLCQYHTFTVRVHMFLVCVCVCVCVCVHASPRAKAWTHDVSFAASTSHAAALLTHAYIQTTRKACAHCAKKKVPQRVPSPMAFQGPRQVRVARGVANHIGVW